MKLRDRLYEAGFKLRYLLTKRGRIAEHSDYVYQRYTDEQNTWARTISSWDTKNIDVSDELKWENDELAGFTSRAELEKYLETEKPGRSKGHMGTWLHWVPLMGVDRSEKE